MKTIPKIHPSRGESSRTIRVINVKLNSKRGGRNLKPASGTTLLIPHGHTNLAGNKIVPDYFLLQLEDNTIALSSGTVKDYTATVDDTNITITWGSAPVSQFYINWETAYIET
jgi:hypothetical protein